MSRYIDADKLRKDEIARCHCVPCVGSNDNNYKDLDEVLNEAPTADVVEVRHGHWIEHTVKPDWLEDDVEVFYNCSECGSSHWSIIPPYCPNCGAKMDGERREE